MFDYLKLSQYIKVYVHYYFSKNVKVQLGRFQENLPPLVGPETNYFNCGGGG